MLDTILERPIFTLVIGLAFGIGLLWVWLQSKYKFMLYLALLIIAITLGSAIIGISVETTREQLTKWTYQTAQELENNDFDALKRKIHPAASNELAGLETQARQIKFQKATIKRVHSIDITGQPPQRKAIIKMNVFAEVQAFGRSIKVPRYIELTLYESDGNWYVYDARHEEPTYAFRKHDE
jgi:hypothetical protein